MTISRKSAILKYIIAIYLLFGSIPLFAQQRLVQNPKVYYMYNLASGTGYQKSRITQLRVRNITDNFKLSNISVTNRQRLTQEVKEALWDYTGNGYKEINHNLRNGIYDSKADIINKYLKTSKISGTDYLFRGYREDISKSFVDSRGFIQDRGFSSTSKDVNVSLKNFASNRKYGEQNVLEIITNVKDAKGVDLSIPGMSHFSYESEVLLQSGLKRKVISEELVEVDGRLLTIRRTKVVKEGADDLAKNISSARLSRKARRPNNVNRVRRISADNLADYARYGSMKKARTVKLFNGIIKHAPMIIEIATDAYDFYKVGVKYYNGQLNKRDVVISASVLGGGILGGAAGAKAGSFIGGAIGAYFWGNTGAQIGSWVGGFVGGAAGVWLGGFFAKKIAFSMTSRMYPTLKSDKYFTQLCDDVEKYYGDEVAM